MTRVIMAREITEEMRKAFGKWLTGKLILMMQQQNRVIDQGELGEELDIDRSLLGKYLSGQAIPGDGKTVRIANFFHDQGVYDVLGYDRPQVEPDQALSFVMDQLEYMDDRYFEKFLEEVEMVKTKRKRKDN